MRFAELDEAQKRDFRERLKGLDLDEGALITDELVVPSGTTMNLSLAPGGQVEARRLVTSDLDTVRRWIATPEKIGSRAVVDKPLRRFPELARLGGVDVARRGEAEDEGGGLEMARAALAKIDPDKLATSVARYREVQGAERQAVRPSSDELAVLRAAAYMHVRGDAEVFAAYKPAVEAYFKEFEIAAWLFTEIRVKANAVLQFGPGANVCKAYRVILEPGAKIRSHGHLTVDCTKLERQKTKFKLPTHIRVRPIITRRHPR